ncbi:MAG: DUF3618 domain-containing protein [Capsulimonadales bacterium]|nr:DUF3618 domain-containing protein [Capsulimonadales bacterium]
MKRPTTETPQETTEVMVVPSPMGVTGSTLGPTGIPVPVVAVNRTTETEFPPESVDTARGLPDDEDDANAPEIVAARADIEETRAQMSETIDAIKERLSPANLIAEAKESATAATVEVAHDLKEATIEKAQELVGNVTDKAKDVASTTTAIVRNAMDYVSEKAAPVVETAQRQLTPAMDTARSIGSTARGAGETIVETIRLNPIPTALIALGIGWLLAAPRRPSNYDMTRRNASDDLYGPTGSDFGKPPVGGATGDGDANGLTTAVRQAGEKVSDLTDDAKSRASEIASQTRNQVESLANATRDNTRSTIRFIDEWVHEEPLTAGAIALLVGASVGLLLPGTDQENRWFGEKRDALAEKASQTAQEAAGKVRQVAETAIDSAKDALTTATDRVKTDLREEAQAQGFVRSES